MSVDHRKCKIFVSPSCARNHIPDHVNRDYPCSEFLKYMLWEGWRQTNTWYPKHDVSPYSEHSLEVIPLDFTQISVHTSQAELWNPQRSSFIRQCHKANCHSMYILISCPFLPRFSASFYNVYVGYKPHIFQGFAAGVCPGLPLYISDRRRFNYEPQTVSLLERPSCIPPTAVGGPGPLDGYLRLLPFDPCFRNHEYWMARAISRKIPPTVQQIRTPGLFAPYTNVWLYSANEHRPVDIIVEAPVAVYINDHAASIVSKVEELYRKPPGTRVAPIVNHPLTQALYSLAAYDIPITVFIEVCMKGLAECFLCRRLYALRNLKWKALWTSVVGRRARTLIPVQYGLVELVREQFPNLLVDQKSLANCEGLACKDCRDQLESDIHRAKDLITEAGKFTHDYHYMLFHDKIVPGTLHSGTGPNVPSDLELYKKYKACWRYITLARSPVTPPRFVVLEEQIQLSIISIYIYTN